MNIKEVDKLNVDNCLDFFEFSDKMEIYLKSSQGNG